MAVVGSDPNRWGARGSKADGGRPIASGGRQRKPSRRRGTGVVASLTGLAVLGIGGVAILGRVLSPWIEPESDFLNPPGAVATGDVRTIHPSAIPTQSPPAGRDLPARTIESLPAANPSLPIFMDLQENGLNAVQVPVAQACPVAREVRTAVDFKASVSEQYECVKRTWRPVLEALGAAPGSEPTLQFYGTSAASACGEEKVAPAFYCSAGRGAIYVGEGTMEAAQRRPEVVKLTLSHEYFHHVQQLSGILGKYRTLDKSQWPIQRVELQTICMEFAALRWDPSFVIEADWVDSVRSMYARSEDDGIHGNAESLVDWVTRGMYASTIGNCNTWVVDESRVR